MLSLLFIKIILCVFGFIGSLFFTALFIDAVVIDFLPKKSQDWWERYF